MRRIILSAIAITGFMTAMAGNPDRIGQAGATQLNINGWARNAGFGWAGVSSVTGVEAMYMNVAGLARINQSEFAFTRTAWLVGTDINVNSFGLAQAVGSEGVLGLSITSFDLGDIPITTEDQPEGGLGTFKPQFNNIGVAYAKRFTNTISGGMLLRVFSESGTNVKANGVCLDAGIQYVTSSNPDSKVKKDDIKFGINIKNVGPDGRYTGDALAIKAVLPSTNSDEQQTVALRSAKFNLPALINIGGSYDFKLDKSEEVYFHRLTAAFNFTSNAFARDQFTLGMEYGYKDMFMLRAGYAMEQGIFDYETRTNVYTGVTGGLTFQVPLSKEGQNANKFAFDYAYRHSNPFSGTHSFGIRLVLDQGE